MSGGPLTFELLGKHYRVTGDRETLDLLELLWAPFVSSSREADTTPIVIEAVGSGWRMQIGEGPTLVGEDIWNFAASFRLALETDVLDSANHLVALHAAVVTDESGALLLVGPVGTGKTTLALALIEQGWHLSSDDVAPIDDTGQIMSFRRPVGIKGSDPWEGYRTRWTPPAWVTAPTHFFQVPAAVFPGSKEVAHAPRAIIFPRYDPAQGQDLRILSPAEATVEAMKHIHRSDHRALSLLSRLCSSVPCARLRYQTSDQAVGQVRKVLSLADQGRYAYEDDLR